jgi:hypothetical protein
LSILFSDEKIGDYGESAVGRIEGSFEETWEVSGVLNEFVLIIIGNKKHPSRMYVRDDVLK